MPEVTSLKSSSAQGPKTKVFPVLATASAASAEPDVVMPSGTLRALSGLATAVLKPIYQKLDELGGKKPCFFLKSTLDYRFNMV